MRLTKYNLRYPVAITISVLATVAIFLFMHRLISGGPLQIDTDDFMVSVDIYQPPPERAQEPEKEPPPQEISDQPVTEPTMAPLTIKAPAPSPQLKAGGPPISSFAPSFDDVALESGSGSIFGSGFGDGNGASKWSGPGGGDDNLAKKIAAEDKKGAEGYREIIPFGTRQPNIPEYAWKNKIDGWVLVAYSVNTNGKVGDVRVLDSQPPGVFDEKVIAAVSDWIYSADDLRGRKAKVQLTQRIELFWKDYPNNNQQLK
jgi:protein TonB